MKHRNGCGTHSHRRTFNVITSTAKSGLNLQLLSESNTHSPTVKWLLRNVQLWNFVNPQLSKNGSNVIDKVQVVFFPCSHLLVFNSCSCVEVKQITSNEKEKCTSHLFLFITCRCTLAVFAIHQDIHQDIISFLQWLLSKQQFHCTLFQQLGCTSS